MPVAEMQSASLWPGVCTLWAGMPVWIGQHGGKAAPKSVHKRSAEGRPEGGALHQPPSRSLSTPEGGSLVVVLRW